MDVGGGAVEADGDAGDVALPDAPGDGFIDERAVGGQGGANVGVAGVVDQFEDVLAAERFAAGEDEDGHERLFPAELGQLVDHGASLRGGEIAAGGLVAVNAAAMGATEIASDGAFPEEQA